MSLLVGLRLPCTSAFTQSTDSGVKLSAWPAPAEACLTPHGSCTLHLNHCTKHLGNDRLLLANYSQLHAKHAVLPVRVESTHDAKPTGRSKYVLCGTGSKLSSV
jgi:hypothetical protein